MIVDTYVYKIIFLQKIKDGGMILKKHLLLILFSIEIKHYENRKNLIELYKLKRKCKAHASIHIFIIYTLQK